MREPITKVSLPVSTSGLTPLVLRRRDATDLHGHPVTTCYTIATRIRKIRKKKAGHLSASGFNVGESGVNCRERLRFINDLW